MEVGLYIRDYMEDPDRPMYEQVEEAAEVCRRAKSLGFSVIYAPQHYISHPTVWMQPMQTLARLASEAEGLKLLTGVVLLPYHNPVDLAEQTVTLDHISNGRFILGAGIGYRVAELSAFGTNRRDRVSRFEESIELMKLLWSGVESTTTGSTEGARRQAEAYTRTEAVPSHLDCGAEPRSRAQSGGHRRPGCTWAAAGMAGHQPPDSPVQGSPWRAGQRPCRTNRRPPLHRHSQGRETAITQARETAVKKAGMYSSFNMQENSTVDFGLGGQRALPDWAVAGTPQDCAEIINRCKEEEEEGLDYIGLASLNLPRQFPARLEYLQLISEELLPHLQ